MKLFYWSLGGLVGLGALVWAIASFPPQMDVLYLVTAEATAPNEWQKLCVKERLVGVGEKLLYHSGHQKPLSECESNDHRVAPFLAYLEDECPSGSCDQPAGTTEGRFMALMWEEQQKVEAIGGYQDFTFYPWDLW